MKILVTGASGLLGFNIIQACLRRNHTPIALTHTHALDASLSMDQFSLDLSEFTTLERLALDHWPDAIVHTAAISERDIVDKNPQFAEHLNVALPRRLAQIAHHIGALFIHISSDMVFSGKQTEPHRTTDLPEPTTLYGQQKLQAEREVLEHCTDRPIVLRIPILNGNGWTGIRSVHEKLFASWSRGKRPTLYTNERRQPTSASDTAEAIIELCERGNLTGIFHWAGLHTVTRAQMGQAILKHFNLPVELIDTVECTESERPLNLLLNLHPIAGKLKTTPLSLDQQIEQLTVPKPAYAWYESQF